MPTWIKIPASIYEKPKMGTKMYCIGNPPVSASMTGTKRK